MSVLEDFRTYVIENLLSVENEAIDFQTLTFNEFMVFLLYKEAKNYILTKDQTSQKILEICWKKIHNQKNFEWDLIFHYGEKLDRDAIHSYRNLNWNFVFDYRNNSFWDWDKLSMRKDSLKMAKKYKNMPWRWNTLTAKFIHNPKLWKFICKNYNLIPKLIFKKLSSYSNFPLNFLIKYNKCKDLWDWDSISSLESLNISFVQANMQLPWNWEIISERF